MILESLRKFLYTAFFTALDRYFYSQLFVNYLIGVSFFASIIMINELYYIIRLYFFNNVPFYQVMSILGALIPFLISFSVPFGVLPAYLLLLGRLSQDSELVSMRACGISQFRIMLPGVMFGVVIMIGAFHFKNIVETKSNLYYLRLKAKILAQTPVVQLLDNVFLNIGTVQISFDKIIKMEDSEDILQNVYAVDVQNRRTIRADEGRIYINPDNPEHYIMKFVQGDLNQISYTTNINTITLTNPVLNIEPAFDQSDIVEPDLPEDDMQIVEKAETNIKEEFYLSSFGAMTLHNYVWLPGDGYFRSPDTLTYKELKKSIDDTPVNITQRMEFLTLESNKSVIDKLAFWVKWYPKIFLQCAQDDVERQEIEKFLQENTNIVFSYQNNLAATIAGVRSKLPNFDIMKLYDKLALPLVALVFAILSLPLGMFSARSGRGEGLSISLVVVLVFYGFKSAVENMVAQNKLIPEMIWLPTFVFAIIAMILYTKKLFE
ncbi:MAG: LptF/LptG family permease [Brevinemataceae bacterium]